MKGTVTFYIKDDVLFEDIPIIGDENLYQTHAIITKEAFVKCYEKWISECNISKHSVEQMKSEIKELADFENVDVLVDVMKIIDKYTK